MTVQSEVSRVSYSGDGSTTVFAVPFYFLANADLTVISRASDGTETEQTLGTHYTLTGAGVSAGGEATFTTAPAAGVTIVILREPAITQLTDYTANDPFAEDSHERALDKLTMLVQKHQENFSRAPLLPKSSSTSDLAFPEPSQGKLIGWKAAADELENKVAVDFDIEALPATASAFLRRNAGNTAYEALAADDVRGVLSLAKPSATRTILKALDTTKYDTAWLAEAGREGMFVWKSGDYSTEITADTQEGIYVKADAIASTAGAWVRAYSGPASVKWFGAKGDNSNADLANLQAASDLVDAVFIPNGDYLTNGPWLLDDYATLHFESRNARITSSSASAIIRARGQTSTRNFHITIWGGEIRGSGTGGPIGLDFISTSDAKVYGTFITQCNEAIKNGGASSLGAYYNDFFGVDITTCLVGVRNGTLGNEIKFFGGRITDVVVGTDDDDNSGVLYDGVAIETFTAAGHRMANSGAACVHIRSIGCRFENPSGNPTYASAVGIDIKATAQDTTIIAPGFTTLATDLSDAGLRTNVFGASEAHKFSGGTQFKKVTKVTVNQAVASLAAGVIRQDSFTIPGFAIGDAISVVLPSSWPTTLMCGGIVPGSGVVYLQIQNPTAGAISLAADNFVFEWTDYT